MENIEHLQNSPPSYLPQESLTADIVIEYLKPVTKPNGPLIIRKLEYVENRANLMLELPAKIHTKKCVSFVGSHMDVVPANPEDWSVDPFKLTVDGDKIYGRGVTDCSGHVALLAQLMKKLATADVDLKANVYVVMIANEENSAITGVGIDAMEKEGELERLKYGPLIWVDSANFGPTLGTAGMSCWKVTVNGKKMHSGLPHKGINAIECCQQVVAYLQRKFYERFPSHDREEEYKFITSSSMKPTQMELPPGPINQIPGECTIKGDIRFLPFYKLEDIQAYLGGLVDNLDLNELEVFGQSRYELEAEDLKAQVKLDWFNDNFYGVACDMDSLGCKVLTQAIDKYHPEGACPFSLTGSLPIIGGLKKAGFDTQIVGFGRMEAYHAVDEYAMISEYEQGFKICNHIIENISNGTKYESTSKQKSKRSNKVMIGAAGAALLLALVLRKYANRG